MGARNMARPTFSKARKGRYRCAGAGWWGRHWFWAGSLRLRVVDYAAQLGHELRHIFNGERAHIEHRFGFGGDYIGAEAGRNTVHFRRGVVTRPRSSISANF